MTARDWSGLREAASLLPDVIEHEGDCASSLCGECDHCLHSIAECECPTCGCCDYSESDEARFRRDVLAALDELDAARDALARVGALEAFTVEDANCNEIGPLVFADDLRAALAGEGSSTEGGRK